MHFHRNSWDIKLIGENQLNTVSQSQNSKILLEVIPQTPPSIFWFSPTGHGVADTFVFRHSEISTMLLKTWGVTILRHCPKHVKMSMLTLFTEEDVIDYSIGTWNHLFSLFWWTLILLCRCRRSSLGPYYYRNQRRRTSCSQGSIIA